MSAWGASCACWPTMRRRGLDSAPFPWYEYPMMRTWASLLAAAMLAAPALADETVTFTVGAHVSKIKALRQRKIALDSSALPTALQGVFELDVDFGAVKGAFPCRPQGSAITT